MASRTERFFEWLTENSAYFRVCLALLGLGFSGLVVWYQFTFWPKDIEEWVLILLFLMPLGIFGIVLLSVASFGSEQKIDRYSKSINEGGDVVALMFLITLGLVAVPITAVIRLLKMRHDDQF